MANKQNQKRRTLILELRAKYPDETGKKIAARASEILNEEVSQQSVSYYSKPVIIKKS